MTYVMCFLDKCHLLSDIILKMKDNGRDTYLEALVRKAKEAGCPEDQLRNFGIGKYVPLPKWLEFHASARECDRDSAPEIIGLGGARGPGKSHVTLAQTGIDDCQRIPGLKVLFLRKFQKVAAESMEDLVTRVLHSVGANFVSSKGVVDFPNGSKMLIGGFRNDADIDKYIGIEYDMYVIEEVNQLSYDTVNKMMGSLRSSRTDWRTRQYWSFNPGGIGHAWLKQHLVEPYMNGTQGDHRLFGKKCKFIPSTYKDNPFLSKEYVNWLESLEGPLGQAWREGNWDIFEGMAFPQWERSKHVIEPFGIPEHWPKWRAVDWGFAKPFCCLWFAQDPDTDRIYVYRELYHAELSDTQQAKTIYALSPDTEGEVRITYADPSMWARKNMRGVVQSTADEYSKQGIILTRADNDRLSGKRKVDRVLGTAPDGEPHLQIFKTCHNLIRTLPSLPFDETRPEDVDTAAEDHAYDALRYGLTKVKAVTRNDRVKERSPLEHVSDIL